MSKKIFFDKGNCIVFMDPIPEKRTFEFDPHINNLIATHAGRDGQWEKPRRRGGLYFSRGRLRRYVRKRLQSCCIDALAVLETRREASSLE